MTTNPYGLTIPGASTDSGLTANGQTIYTGNSQTTPTYLNMGLKAATPVAPSSGNPTLSIANTASTKSPYMTAPQATTPAPAKSSSYNASVAAQQQALNAKGANLTVDGIMGPLTQAAITKYSSASSAPATSNNGLIGNAISSSGYSTIPGAYDPVTGQLKSTQDATQTNSASNSATNPTPVTQTPPTSNAGLLTTLAGAGVGGTTSPDITNWNQKINDIQNAQAQANANIDNSGVDRSLATGQEAVLNTKFGSELTAAQGGLTNALTAQGQKIGATTSALGATQPVNQFGQLTNPQTGTPVSGGSYTSNPQLQTAVQQAVQLVQNGADVNSPQVQSLLTTFGLPGQSAFTQAMQQVSNGTYNPTAQSTTAQTNASQGATYQQQATQLSTTIQQLDGITPAVTNFLSGSGLNTSGTPIGNKNINQYIAQLKNPADAATLNAMMGDVKTYTAQILGNSGLNPTEVSSVVNSFDPSLLNSEQLSAFLANLRNLGEIRLQPLQNTSSSSYGSSSAFSGSAANPSSSSQYATDNYGALITNNPQAEAAGGAVMNILGSASSLGSEALGFFTKLFGS